MYRILTLTFSLVLLTLLSKADADSCFFKWNYPSSGSSTVSFFTPPHYQSGRYQVSWDFGDTTLSTEKNPVHTYTSNLPRYVSFDVLDTVLQVAICHAHQQIDISACGYSFGIINNQTGLFGFQCPTATLSDTVQWHFGDNGPLITGTSVLHHYMDTGRFTVTCENISAGCTRTFQVYNVSEPPCKFEIVNAQTDSPFRFKLLSKTRDYQTSQSRWTFFNGLSHVYQGQSLDIQLWPGTNYICLSEDSPSGFCQQCIIYNVPSCSYFSTQQSTPHTFTFITQQADIGANFAWDFSNGQHLTTLSDTVSYTFPGPGTYQVQLFVRNSNLDTTCTYTQTIHIPDPGLCAFTTSRDSLQPNQITFTSLQNPAYLYQWNFDDTHTDTGAVTTHTYPAFGNFYPVLSAYHRMTQQPVCESSSLHLPENRITLWPQNCSSGFTYATSGLNVFFIGQATPSQAVFAQTHYLWDFGDGTTSTQFHPYHSFSVPGTYMVRFGSYSESCYSTSVQAVQVDTALILPSSCEAYFAITQDSLYRVLAVNLSSGTNPVITWNFGDGSPSVTEPYPLHSYASTGSYPVCLTVSDNNGCSDTFCDTLTVDASGILWYRGISIGFQFQVVPPTYFTTGVTPTDNALRAEVFPVPAQSELLVRLPGTMPERATYRLLSPGGVPVSAGTISGELTRISLQNVAAGMYLIEITDANHARIIKKCVKQ